MNKKINGVAKAIAAAAATAMSLGLAVAPAAFADDGLGNIDTTKTGSLTIEKHKQTSANGTQQGDGTQQDNVEGDLMAGVTFDLYKVDGFDLTQAANWDDLSGLTAQGQNVVANGKKVGTIDGAAFKTGETGANGQITWTGLPLGLYYVVEGNYSGTDGQISQKAQPFFVSIPYPNANKAWNYDVYVYPKNSFGTTVKRVDENSLKTSYKVGDDVSWNIDQDVPTLGTGETLKKFGIVDRMDPNVTYKGVKVEALDASGNVVATPAFAVGADYTVVHETRENDTHDYVNISFTDAGLEKLKNSVSKVRFNVTATVSADLADPTVQNDVFPITNDYDPFHSGETNPPVPSEDQPYYGDYRFTKVDDANKTLQGATFNIWRKDIVECAVDTVPDAAVSAVSGADGTVSFSGLLIGLGDKGLTADQMKNLTADFCLRETQAPAGFVTPSADQTQTVTIHAGRSENGTVGDNVINTKQTGPKLPMTGAAGTILLTAVAVIALGAAFSLYVVNMRRRQN